MKFNLHKEYSDDSYVKSNCGLEGSASVFVTFISSCYLLTELIHHVPVLERFSTKCSHAKSVVISEEVGLFTGVYICADVKMRGSLEISHPITSARRNVCTSLRKVSFSFIRFQQREDGTCRQILVNLPNVKFCDNPFSRSRLLTWEKTWAAILIGAPHRCESTWF
jgi:hypothetical protein